MKRRPKCLLDVLQVTTVHTWKDNRIFHKQCRSLAAAGFSVALVAPDAPGGPAEGVNTFRLGTPPGGRLGRFLFGGAMAFWRCLSLSSKVVHIHDPELIPVALLAKLCGRRIVYDVHEDYPTDILSKPWLPVRVRRPMAALCGFLERIAIRAFDGVVAATPAIVKRLIRYNSNTVLVANYPRAEELGGIAQSIPGERKDVVYVGYLTTIRGIRVLVDAMQFVSARLVLAGEFTDRELEAYVRARLSPNRIEYIGWVARKELPELLKSAAVGLVPFLPEPAHIEALPNKLFEYMAAGIPVIASDFPSWKQLIEGQGVGWCVPAGDPKALAACINRVLSDPEGASAAGARGRDAVERELNWSAAFKELIRAYARLDAHLGKQAMEI